MAMKGLLFVCVIFWLAACKAGQPTAPAIAEKVGQPTAPAVAEEDDSSANRLFVGAAQLLSNAEKATTVTLKFELLKRAERKLRSIVQCHPSSGLAVKLVSNQPIGSISMADVANALNKALLSARASVLLDAVAALALVEDTHARADMLYHVAIAQANAGDSQGSRKTSAEADAVAETVKGDAGTVVLTFNDNPVVIPYAGAWHANTLSDLAAAQAKAGDIQAAKETFAVAVAAAESIKGDLLRANTLGHLAAAQAKAGDIQAAKETFAVAVAAAESIKGDLPRANTLSDLAAAQAKAGDIERARSLSGRAIAAARLVENSDTGRWMIARLQAEIGDINGAVATVLQENAPDRNNGTETLYRLLDSLRIIAQYAYFGPPLHGPIDDGDEEAYGPLGPWIERIKNKEDRDRLRDAYLNAHKSNADINLDAATAVALAVEDSNDRFNALRAIVSAQMREDERGALATAWLMENADQRSETLEAIATMHAGMGYFEIDHFEKAVAVARVIEAALPRARAFIAIDSAMQKSVILSGLCTKDGTVLF